MLTLGGFCTWFVSSIRAYVGNDINEILLTVPDDVVRV